MAESSSGKPRVQLQPLRRAVFSPSFGYAVYRARLGCGGGAPWSGPTRSLVPNVPARAQSSDVGPVHIGPCQSAARRRHVSRRPTARHIARPVPVARASRTLSKQTVGCSNTIDENV
ncbi:unnamed protein product, partial [Iphiclides podalirius]